MFSGQRQRGLEPRVPEYGRHYEVHQSGQPLQRRANQSHARRSGKRVVTNPEER